MTPHERNAVVCRATGKSLATVERIGFHVESTEPTREEGRRDASDTTTRRGRSNRSPWTPN